MFGKTFKIIAAAVLIATALSTVSFAGQWLQYGQNWCYQKSDGSFARNQWVGNYYLGSDGIMYTNSWTPDGYYVDATGKWDGRSAYGTSTTYEPVNAIGQIHYNSPRLYGTIWGENKLSYAGTPVEIIRSNDNVIIDRGTYYELPNCVWEAPCFDEYGDFSTYDFLTGPIYIRKNALADTNSGTMTAEQLIQYYGSLHQDSYYNGVFRTVGEKTYFDSNGYITRFTSFPFG
ncbi:hypothetical protein SAMN05216349_11927 [Oribacterium sp. KHPX15]|uniref:hypothetical protein n=1 Tax=Oribacterium sp. KHPX15 TaxID=1855342 RepID=UPI000895E94B|nr:hypothetical protein [Oribacterium sp. KHPX15]SEA61834.1 hypothetical protein SAMN05216349_11927 [Oribacterium sp. KHPX15]